MLESDMDTKLANKTDNLSFASIKLRSKDMTNRFMSNRKTLTEWFESGTNHQIYSDAMNYKRGLLSKQILKSKKTKKFYIRLSVVFVARSIQPCFLLQLSLSPKVFPL